MKGYNINLLIISLSMFFFLNTQYLIGQKKGTSDTLFFIHTNDTHSRIEAMPKNDKRNPEAGGYALRSYLINKFKTRYPELLIFDSGDFLQGTPYFNFFKGELEVELMNRLGYTAVTLGNHEFDNGVNALANILTNAKFDIISSNYDVSNTPLKKMVKPYKIYKVNEFKIGVIGIGVNPEGLISPENFKGIKYSDPIKVANKLAKFLKRIKRCDIVICLSHLGFSHNDDRPSDVRLAQNSRNIDIIMGGHTHSLIESEYFEKNLDGKKILITQNGSKGLFMSLIYSIVN